ncbi:hypothetical protein ABT156_41415, partial [Streptomyces sp. NPDC001833]
NPDIRVKYVGVPAASVQSKYDTAIQGGGLPDVPRAAARAAPAPAAAVRRAGRPGRGRAATRPRRRMRPS